MVGYRLKKNMIHFVVVFSILAIISTTVLISENSDAASSSVTSTGNGTISQDTINSWEELEIYVSGCVSGSLIYIKEADIPNAWVADSVISINKIVTIRPYNTFTIDASTSCFTVEDGGELTLGYESCENMVTFNGSQSTSRCITIDNGGKMTLNDGITISNFTTSGNGGAVISYGDLIINGGTISYNSALNGGGIRLESGTFTMNGGTITRNESVQNGGGIAIRSSDTDTEVLIYGGNITNNKALGTYKEGYGGGIFAFLYGNKEIHITIEGKTGDFVNIQGNTAAMYGGGISLHTKENTPDYSSRIILQTSNLNITGNEAKWAGGLRVDNGTATLGAGTEIYENISTGGNGAGVILKNGTLTVDGASITGNISVFLDIRDQYGAGIYILGGTAKLNSGTIKDNVVKVGSATSPDIYAYRDVTVGYNTGLTGDKVSIGNVDLGVLNFKTDGGSAKIFNSMTNKFLITVGTQTGIETAITAAFKNKYPDADDTKYLVCSYTSTMTYTKSDGTAMPDIISIYRGSPTEIVYCNAQDDTEQEGIVQESMSSPDVASMPLMVEARGSEDDEDIIIVLDVEDQNDTVSEDAPASGDTHSLEEIPNE